MKIHKEVMFRGVVTISELIDAPKSGLRKNRTVEHTSHCMSQCHFKCGLRDVCEMVACFASTYVRVIQYGAIVA